MATHPARQPPARPAPLLAFGILVFVLYPTTSARVPADTPPRTPGRGELTEGWRLFQMGPGVPRTVGQKLYLARLLERHWDLWALEPQVEALAATAAAAAHAVFEDSARRRSRSLLLFVRETRGAIKYDLCEQIYRLLELVAGARRDGAGPGGARRRGSVAGHPVPAADRGPERRRRRGGLAGRDRIRK